MSVECTTHRGPDRVAAHAQGLRANPGGIRRVGDDRRPCARREDPTHAPIQGRRLRITRAPLSSRGRRSGQPEKGATEARESWLGSSRGDQEGRAWATGLRMQGPRDGLSVPRTTRLGEPRPARRSLWITARHGRSMGGSQSPHRSMGGFLSPHAGPYGGILVPPMSPMGGSQSPPRRLQAPQVQKHVSNDQEPHPSLLPSRAGLEGGPGACERRREKDDHAG